MDGYSPGAYVKIKKGEFKNQIGVVSRYIRKTNKFRIITSSTEKIVLKLQKDHFSIVQFVELDPGLSQRLKLKVGNFGYTNYVDVVFGMKCFSELVRLQVYPDAKEISEAYGALLGITHMLFPNLPRRKAWRQKGVLILCVGDGSTPRCGALVAFLTRWKAITIDPCLKERWIGENPEGVRNLTGFSNTIEDWVDVASFDSNVEHLGLLCVHAHVRLRGKVSIQNLRKRYEFPRTLLLSIPCCGKFRFQADMRTKPDREYEDPCIFSKHRKVRIWEFPKGDATEKLPPEELEKLTKEFFINRSKKNYEVSDRIWANLRARGQLPDQSDANWWLQRPADV